MIEETESIEYYKIRKYLLINTQITAALWSFSFILLSKLVPFIILTGNTNLSYYLAVFFKSVFYGTSVLKSNIQILGFHSKLASEAGAEPTNL